VNNEQVSVGDMSPLHVHVTHNVAIFRQLGMWTDLKKAYTFVPSRKRGFVLVMKIDRNGKDQLVQGYTLYRPCGLELSWHTDRIVIFHELGKIAAIEEEHNANGKLWQVIGDSWGVDDSIPF